MSTLTLDEQIALVKTYFQKVDNGDPSLLDLFTDDAQAYFPTFGIAHGKPEILRFVVGLTTAVKKYDHDPAAMIFTGNGDRLAVEGTETGTFSDGRSFPGDAASGGRFCNVYEFRGGLISRLHIYADPDYAGVRPALFVWG